MSEVTGRNSPKSPSYFRQSLLIPTTMRSTVDVDLIYKHLSDMQAITPLPDSAVRSMAASARYEVHESNELLYHADHFSTCWYILLSGSVYLDGCMYLPGSSFGKQSVDGRRGSECLILEKSEMIVIDYPDGKLLRPYQRQSYSTQDLEKLLALESDEVKVGAPIPIDDTHLPKELRHVKEIVRRSEAYLDRIGKEESKETKQRRSASKYGYADDDISVHVTGLKDTMDVLDSDEDEDDVISTSSESSAAVRDIVRDCLEKDPSERIENDINILMEFMQHLPAFGKLAHNVRREMCKVMVFAVVEDAGSIVLADKEELDSWSVILNGSVEILEDGNVPVTLDLGDSFGVKTKQETVFHKGIMKTRMDDCQFVCVAQEDYWRIFSQGEASTQKVEEEGEIVMVTEHRTTDGGSRQGQVVIKGTCERLLDHLMDDHSMIDPTYVEDFLLTCVVFYNEPHEIAKKLLKWFERPQLKDKVTRVMLLWVNNHYSDFEGDAFMENCLGRVENLLQAKKMLGQLRLLNMACSMKSKPRTMILERKTLQARLEFSICGGKDLGFGIFISKVDYDSKAEELGLRRGDQILEVNGQSFESITGPKAIEALMSRSHLSLTVKANVIGFKAVNLPKNKQKKSSSTTDDNCLLLQNKPMITRSTSDGGERNQAAFKNMKNFKENGSPIGQHKHSIDQLVLPHNPHDTSISIGRSSTRLRRAMIKLNLLPRSGSDRDISQLPDHRDHSNHNGKSIETTKIQPTHNSMDNLLSSQNEMAIDSNSQVIRVHRSDQSYRYLIVTKDTTVREVLLQAFELFGMTGPQCKSSFLCEVIVCADGLVKQKRLPETARNLVSRLSLNGRYYVKSTLSDGGMPDEVAQEIARDAQITFLQFSPLEIARELTLMDFDLFRGIDSREYIYNLFESKKEEKYTRMRNFEETTEIEMFWVIKEIVSELNFAKRVKVIKHFIKIAKLCKEFKNYNSMFAVVSGLGHSAVGRLKLTWDKIPAKYVKIFEDLEELLDPSRNMSKYRNLFNGDRGYPPLIPFFPVVKKDITFTHLGNDTYVDGLVNFEKLRMIAKEIRKVCKYYAIGYDPNKMDDASTDNYGAAPSIAQSVVSVMTGQGGVNRKSRRTSSGYGNPKKVYEETLLNRRIREYLERLPSLKSTEDELRDMSHACEPPPSSMGTPQSKKRISPSPSPSPSPSLQKKQPSITSMKGRALPPLPMSKSADDLSPLTSANSTPGGSLPSSPSVMKSSRGVVDMPDAPHARHDEPLPVYSPRRRLANISKREDVHDSQAYPDSLSSSASSPSPLSSVQSNASFEAYHSPGYSFSNTRFNHFPEVIDFEDEEGQVSVV